MTNQEMILILKGTTEQKLSLFNGMLSRAVDGVPLSDSEIPIFEALKRELVKQEPVIVQMQANLTGNSSAGVG